MPAYWPRVRSLNPRGDWNAVDTYFPGDVVFDQGSSWITVQLNTNSRPPGPMWWGPYAPQGDVGFGGGHTIRDIDGTELAPRPYLHFVLNADKPHGTILDSAVNGEIEVDYPLYIPTLAELNARLGVGYEAYVPFTPEPGNFEAAALPESPPLMALDYAANVRLKGRVISLTGGSPLKIGQLPLDLTPRGTVRLPTVKGDGSRTFVRIDGNGNMWTDVAGAGESVYLDGLRYPSGAGIQMDLESELIPDPPDKLTRTQDDTEFGHNEHLRGWGVIHGNISSGFILAHVPSFSPILDMAKASWSITWLITEGPDEGATDTGGFTNYTSDHAADYDPPIVGLPDPPPIAFLDTIPVALPGESVVDHLALHIDLLTAPFNVNNTYRIYFDIYYIAVG